MLWFTSVASIVVAAAVAEPPGPLLEVASRQVQALRFAAATQTLELVRRSPSLTRKQVLEYYELTGVVAGSMGDGARSGDSSSARQTTNLRPASAFATNWAITAAASTASSPPRQQS